MRFFYEYRTHENKRRSGVISAPDRDSAFAMLKSRGIRPSSVREAPGLWNKLFGKGKRWMLIGVLLFLVVVLAGVLHRQAKNANEQESQGKFAVRSQIYGDSWVLKSISANRWADVFESEGDRFLACHAIPGRDCGCKLLGRVEREAICRTLVEEVDRLCVIMADDLFEVVEIKRMVNGLKREMKEYLDAGGSAEKYISRLDIRQTAEIGILKSARSMLQKSQDAMVWRSTNLKMRNMGLPMISPSENFQDALEYPQFLTPETRHEPDSIGRDAFSEVK